jgi:hypothetical protein
VAVASSTVGAKETIITRAGKKLLLPPKKKRRRKEGKRENLPQGVNVRIRAVEQSQSVRGSLTVRWWCLYDSWIADKIVKMLCFNCCFRDDVVSSSGATVRYKRVVGNEEEKIRKVKTRDRGRTTD